MVVLPAIDMKGGRVVRLRQGRADDETIYGDDPAAVATQWQSDGAEWIHLVDLDGAFDGESANLGGIHAILSNVNVPCELGGGIRTFDQAAKLLVMGIARVIFGTVAVREPDVVKRTVDRFGPSRVVVGIDAQVGKVAIKGWTEISDASAVDLARSMGELGVERIVYTDIARDGMGTGVNVDATARLARETGMRIIASGGVHTIDDVTRLLPHESDGIEGVIIGRALYDGTITLREAIDTASDTH
jgi:phosphoribosylformimino-5-aminoimidazole carboxamide ribotide isomerase